MCECVGLLLPGAVGIAMVAMAIRQYLRDQARFERELAVLPAKRQKANEDFHRWFFGDPVWDHPNRD